MERRRRRRRRRRWWWWWWRRLQRGFRPQLKTERLADVFTVEGLGFRVHGIGFRAKTAIEDGEAFVGVEG